MRGWLILMVVAVVANVGCAPKFSSISTDVQVFPSIKASTFLTFDGSELPLRVWTPQGKPQGVVLAVHGFNDYSNFIDKAAQFFNEHGLAVYAYDQRGFGNTATRGRWQGGQVMAEDLRQCLFALQKTYPQLPVFVFGDSMGGAVSILALADMVKGAPQGLILVAPAVWSRSEMPFYQRLALWVGARLFPGMTVTGESLEVKPSDNRDMLIRLGKDPFIIKETRIDSLYGLTNLMDDAFRSAERLSTRTLLLYGDLDEVIPVKPVMRFYKRLPHHSTKHQQMVRYPEGYHMLHRDLQAQKVWEDILKWIKHEIRNHRNITGQFHN